MPDWHRRSVLATGAALSAGYGFPSIGAGASESAENGVEDLPDPDLDPNPGLDEDWASYRGDAGHTRFVENGYEFDGDALEVAWSADHDGRVAVADETVYTSNADGVVALDAADGTSIWENTDVDASDPAVAGETAYFVSDAGIVALDRSDGEVRWKRDFEAAELISRHTVAYDGVYVVADGTLYALETDGSVRWKRDSVAVESPAGERESEFEFVRSPAAANGVVYAATKRTVLALEPETGTEVWRYDERYADTPSSIYANSTAVVVDWWSTVDKGLHDPYTGEMEGTIHFEPPHELALDDELYATGNYYRFDGGSIEDDEYGWSVSTAYNAGQAVISGETAYVYFGNAFGEWGDYDGELVALDKYDGSEKWTVAKADAPVGAVRAVSGETLYVDHDGELVALRERTDDEDDTDADGAPGFTTGTGIGGGALGLEWLRRRATADEPAE